MKLLAIPLGRQKMAAKWLVMEHTEEMVRRFARYHKYTVGIDLRTRVMRLMREVNTTIQKNIFEHHSSLITKR
jgi:hypothetical protein